MLSSFQFIFDVVFSLVVEFSFRSFLPTLLLLCVPCLSGINENSFHAFLSIFLSFGLFFHLSFYSHCLLIIISFWCNFVYGLCRAFSLLCINNFSLCLCLFTSIFIFFLLANQRWLIHCHHLIELLLFFRKSDIEIRNKIALWKDE